MLICGRIIEEIIKVKIAPVALFLRIGNDVNRLWLSRTKLNDDRFIARTSYVSFYSGSDISERPVYDIQKETHKNCHTPGIRIIKRIQYPN
jgi:hypothetical protein